MKIEFIALTLALAPMAAPAQEAREFSTTLVQAENRALASSQELAAARAQADAAEQAFQAARANLYPKLTLDGNYKYVTRIPEITMPNSSRMMLGDHNNYSIGPTMSWTLWDNGSSSENTRSAEADFRSKKAQAEAAARKIRLSTRLAYIRSVLANDRSRLLADGLAIVRRQHQDIQSSVRAGSKNRIDELVAHREVLSRTNQLSRARAELSSALLELSALTADSSSPFEQPFPRDVNVPQGLPPASDSVELDGFETILSSLKTSAGPDLASPSLRALEQTAAALELAAQALESSRGPKLLASARSSLDFPNGPQLYSFGQNTAGVSLSLPLFEKGRTAAQAMERRLQARAGTRSRRQLEADIRRDWNKARSQLASLYAQQAVNVESVGEARELSALIYKAYQDGRYTYFDVESANLRTLEAQLQAADTAAQILAQQALLSSISSEEGK